MNKSLKIKIFTRSANIELYTYSKKLTGNKFPKVRLCNTTADGYFYEMLSDLECDVAINIDEDAFSIDEDALMDLVNYVVENNYVNAGMPDGGMLQVRAFNPIITNPFFNVLNLKLIREKFSLEEIQNFDYAAHKDELINNFPSELLAFENNGFNYDNYEPFYPFFFWLAQNFKTLYLHGVEHSDGISTILHNHDGKPFLYHSWWSRVYNTDSYHHKRIQALIHEAYALQGIPCKKSCVILLARKIEFAWQNFKVDWEHFWILGKGAWLYRHIKKSPMHYIRRTKELLFKQK